MRLRINLQLNAKHKIKCSAQRTGFSQCSEESALVNEMLQSQKHLPKSWLLPGQHASLLNNTNALLSFPPCNTPSVFTTSPYLAGQTAGKPTKLCFDKQTSAILSSNLPAVWKRWEGTVVKHVRSRWRLREITLSTGRDLVSDWIKQLPLIQTAGVPC